VPTPGLALELTDTRGPFTILVYSDGGSNDFCTVGPSFRNASGWSTSPPAAPPAGRLFLWTDHTSTDDGQSYGSMIARAGDGVSAAKLTLDDGSVATATVENGWAVAWWPGAHHLAARAADDALGHAHADVPGVPVRRAQRQRRRPARRRAEGRSRRRPAPALDSLFRRPPPGKAAV
jgi:hypothetical protein